MASRLVAAASSSFPLARLSSRRGLAGATGRHGHAKVNLWEDPKNPMRWKDGHFVIVSMSIWGGLVYGGFKLFGGRKENKTKEGEK